MMNTDVRRRPGQAGFSVVELAIVVMIGLIVTVAGVSRMNVAIANLKLRSSLTSVSGLLQNCRMIAVQRNTTLTTKFVNAAVPVNAMKAVVTTSTDTTNSPIAADAQVEMEAPISSPSTVPAGAGAPPAITNSQLGLSSD